MRTYIYIHTYISHIFRYSRYLKICTYRCTISEWLVEGEVLVDYEDLNINKSALKHPRFEWVLNGFVLTTCFFLFYDIDISGDDNAFAQP